LLWDATPEEKLTGRTQWLVMNYYGCHGEVDVELYQGWRRQEIEIEKATAEELWERHER